MDDNATLDKGEAAAKPLTRLENMDVSFVSLVTAGANRQKAFMIIKALTCPGCGAAVDPEDENCPACGFKMVAAAKEDENKAPRSDTVAASKDLDAASESPASNREGTMGKQSATSSEPTTPAVPSAEFLAKLAEASEAISMKMAEIAFEKSAAAEAPPPAAQPEPPLQEPPARVETAKAEQSETIAKALAEREQELSVVKAELEKAKQAQVAAEARARALKATVGASHAMPSGEIAKAKLESNKPAPPKKLWAPDMNTLR